MLLPSEDIPYYRRNLLEKNNFYYSDYCDARNNNEIAKINKSLENEGGRSRVLVKSTPYGALYQNLGDDNNKSAFVTGFILPFIIISLSLLIPILSIMFSRM